jgi:hypothetical protein
MLRVKARQINHGRAEAEATRTLIVAEAVTDAAVKKVCQGIVRRLRTEGDWVSASVVRKVIPARAREHFEAAIERLLEAGQIEIEQVDKGRHLRLTQNT